LKKRPQAISRYLQHSDQLSTLQRACREETELLRVIKQQFARELTDHITGLHRNSQVVTLYVDAQVWASRIRYLSKMIAAEVKSKEVRVVVSPSPLQHEQLKTEHGTPRHSDKASEVLNRAADCTSDEQLKAVLLRLSNAVRQ